MTRREDEQSRSVFGRFARVAKAVGEVARQEVGDFVDDRRTAQEEARRAQNEAEEAEKARRLRFELKARPLERQFEDDLRLVWSSLPEGAEFVLYRVVEENRRVTEQGDVVIFRRGPDAKVSIIVVEPQEGDSLHILNTDDIEVERYEAGDGLKHTGRKVMLRYFLDGSSERLVLDDRSRRERRYQDPIIIDEDRRGVLTLSAGRETLNMVFDRDGIGIPDKLHSDYHLKGGLDGPLVHESVRPQVRLISQSSL